MKFLSKLNILNCNVITSVVALLILIHVYNSTRTRHYLCRKAIVDAKLSPWMMKLYMHGDEKSFLNLTGRV